MSPRNARVRRSRRRTQRSCRGCLLWILLPLIAFCLGALAYRLWPHLLPRPARIGIIAGHWQSDSGATCPDGLREVDITLPIAETVVKNLRLLGYQADVLPEYGREMRSYRGLAVISLHADSCVNLSGFKVAGRSSGPSAAASTRLVQSLTASYAAATGLSFHHNTVTLDMTQYHAFGEIDPGTPVAIIEMGFMGGDRALLTTQQDAIVRGLVEGLLEFLKSERTRD